MVATTDVVERFEYVVHTADDAAAHSHSATAWSHQYEQVSASRFSATHAEAWLGPLQAIYERIEGAYRYSGRPWDGCRVFLSFLPGSGQILYDGRPVPTGAILTYRSDTLYRVTCSRLTETVAVAVDESFLERSIGIRAHCVGLDREHRLPVICTQDPIIVEGFERAVLGTLRTIGEAPAILQDERERRALQQAVLAAIGNAVLAETPDDSRLPSASTRAYIVEKATRFIEARLADPLSVGDISAAVRVCPRTLRYSFETVLGVTPTQYVRAQRLSRVRRELLAGCCDSIQSAATRWGFWHMGRFAKYYRQTFGEPPSRTAPVAPRAVADAATVRNGSPGLPDCFYRVANERLAAFREPVMLFADSPG